MKKQLNSSHRFCPRLQCSMAFTLGLCLASLLFPLPLSAQTITTDTNFSFGRFALLNFVDVQQIDIASNGTFIKSADIWFLQDPQRGIYLVSDAPPNTNFTITVPNQDITLSGIPGRSLLVDNLMAGPASPRTNASGEATFWVYGRMQTRGDMSYPDETLGGDMEITLTFDN